MASYYPNSTDCAGWDGDDSTAPPNTLTFDNTEFSLSSGELDTISTDDGDCISFYSSPSYPGQRIQFAINEVVENLIEIELTFKGYGHGKNAGEGDEYGWKLWMWNNNSSAWELLDSHTSSSKATLSGSKTTNLSNYVIIDGNKKYVYGLVMADPANAYADRTTYLYFARCTTSAQEPPIQEHVGIVSLAITGTDDAQTYLDVVGEVALAVTGESDIYIIGIEHQGQIALTVTGMTDVPAEHQGTVALATTGVSVLQTYAIHTGTVVDVLTGRSDITSYPAEDVGQAVIVITAMTDDLCYPDEHIGEVVLVQTGMADSAAMREHQGTTILALTGVMLADEVGTVALAQIGVFDMHCFPLSLALSAGNEELRRIQWNSSYPDGTWFYVCQDGTIRGRTQKHVYDLNSSDNIREILQVGVPPSELTDDEIEGFLRTPHDCVRLTWNDVGADHYIIERKLGAESWAEIATVLTTSYLDGPLKDGSYTWRITAVDEEGDETVSNEVNKTISSAPNPPSGLSLTYDESTRKLNLVWTPSESADIQDYLVRSSEGEQLLRLDSEPIATPEDPNWGRYFTTENGLYIFSVQARDKDGRIERNLSEIAMIFLANGLPEAIPAEPRILTAEASAGGKVKVSWLYDPHFEYQGPGAAHEARIYWDAGTGTINWNTPKTTVAMGNPTAADWWSWESEALTDGQEYLFVVRIATAAHPDGIETQNTDEHAATPDSSVPDAPILQGMVV